MQNDPEELWLPVPGFEENYAVSDAGRVQRLTRGNGTRPGRVLKTGNRRGYRFYALSVDSVTSYKAAHRLVYEAFVGPIANGMQINHKNGDKADNRLMNLEITTPSQNTAHAYRVLGLPGRKNPNPGERNGRAKLTWPIVREIRQRYSAGSVSQKALSTEYGVCSASINFIISGITWRE